MWKNLFLKLLEKLKNKNKGANTLEIVPERATSMVKKAKRNYWDIAFSSKLLKNSLNWDFSALSCWYSIREEQRGINDAVARTAQPY